MIIQIRKFTLAFLWLVLVSGIWSCSFNGQQSSANARQVEEETFALPDPRDAVIYQVNIRSFSKSGNFAGVEARLDEIKDLGANVIYLMPIYPVGQKRSAGGLGSPYAVKDYRAINPDFGNLEDLKSLVSAAHERNIAVMLDWVANHTSWDNAWITAHKDWYQQDENENIIIPPNTNWQDVAQLNYENPELWEEMIGAMKYWVINANIDGFRCDAANWVPYEFWKQAVSELRTMENQELLLLAEGDRKDHFKAGFDYIFGFNFFYKLKDQVFEENKPVTLIDSTNRTAYASVLNEQQRVVRYVSNHDVNIYEGTPQELFGGQNGSIAAFVVAAYMRGVPMIYNGQEIGYPERLEFFSRTPIDWGKAVPEVLAKYKEIIDLYQNSAAIRRGEPRSFSNEDVVAFTKEADGEKVLVIVNLRDKSLSYQLPATLAQSVWKEAFTDKEIRLENNIALEPYSYLVLTN